MPAEPKSGWSRWFNRSQRVLPTVFLESSPGILVEKFGYDSIAPRKGNGAYLDRPGRQYEREIMLETTTSSPSESSNSHQSQSLSDVGHGDFRMAMPGLPTSSVIRHATRPRMTSRISSSASHQLVQDLRAESSELAPSTTDVYMDAHHASIAPLVIPATPTAATVDVAPDLSPKKAAPRKLRKKPPPSSYNTPYIVEPLPDHVLPRAHPGHRSVPTSSMPSISRTSSVYSSTTSSTHEYVGDRPSASTSRVNRSSVYFQDSIWLSNDVTSFSPSASLTYMPSTYSSGQTPSTVSASSHRPLLPSSSKGGEPSTSTHPARARKLTKRRPSMPTIPSSPYTEINGVPLDNPPVARLSFMAMGPSLSPKPQYVVGPTNLPQSMHARRAASDNGHASSGTLPYMHGPAPAFAHPALPPFKLAGPPSTRSSRDPALASTSELELFTPPTSNSRGRALSMLSLRRVKSKGNISISAPKQTQTRSLGRRTTVSEAGHEYFLAEDVPLPELPARSQLRAYQPSTHSRRVPFTTSPSSPIIRPEAPEGRVMMSFSTPDLPLLVPSFVAAQLGLDASFNTIIPSPQTITCDLTTEPESFLDTGIPPVPVRPRMPHRDSHPSRWRWTLQMAMNDDSISNEVLAQELDRLRAGASWYKSDGKEDLDGEAGQAWSMYGGPHPKSSEEDNRFSQKLSLRIDAATNTPTYIGKSAESPFPTTPASAQWTTARRALLTVRETVTTERSYLAFLHDLVSGNTTSSPPPLMLRYAEGLVQASEALLSKMEDDPSAWGLANAFIASVDALDAALVGWCGVVGGFFTSGSKFKLTKERGVKAAVKSTTPSPPSEAASDIPDNHSYTKSLSKRSTGTWRRSMPAMPGALVISPITALPKRNFGKDTQMARPSVSPAASFRQKNSSLRNKLSIGKEREKDWESSKSSGSSSPVETLPKPRRKAAVRDLAILPTQRVMRYVLLFQDLVRQTPETSPSRAVLERALDAALQIAEKCDRAQGNAAFLFNSSRPSTT